MKIKVRAFFRRHGTVDLDVQIYTLLLLLLLMIVMFILHGIFLDEMRNSKEQPLLSG